MKNFFVNIEEAQQAHVAHALNGVTERDVDEKRRLMQMPQPLQPIFTLQLILNHFLIIWKFSVNFGAILINQGLIDLFILDLRHYWITMIFLFNYFS